MIHSTVWKVLSGSIDLPDNVDKINTKSVKKEFNFVKLVIINVLICPCIVTRLH